MIHFINFVKLVAIKQTHLLSRLNRLLISLKSSDYRANKRNFARQYRSFQRVNSNLAYQCLEIRGYNRFWSTLVTYEFAGTIGCFCCMLYYDLFNQTSFSQKVFFLFFCGEFGVIMFVAIFRCSKVARNSERAYECNMKIFMTVQLKWTGTYSFSEIIHVRI